MSAAAYGYIISAITFGGNSKGNPMGSTDRLMVDRLTPTAGEQVVVGGRPINNVDLLAEIQFADHADASAEDDDAGNIVTTYKTSDGSTGSMTAGPFVLKESDRVVGRGGAVGAPAVFTNEVFELETTTGDTGGITRSVSV